MWYLLSGIFLGGTLGANDAANIFGTAVTTRSVKFKTAVTLTGIFVILGSALEGAGGIETVGSLSEQSIKTAFISSLAAALTVSLMTYLKLPVSTSQAVVGAVIGGNILIGNVNFILLVPIVIAWVATPLGAMMIAFIIYKLYSIFVQDKLSKIQYFERFVQIGLLISGIYGAYSLGANNVANVIGVYVKAGLFDSQIGGLVGGMAIALGVNYSRGVMETVGNKITSLTPLTALIAVLSHSITLYIFARIGIPVSSSQAIVGGVIGTGLVKGVNMLDWKTTKNIIFGWVGTPSIAVVIGIILQLTMSSLGYL
ncbi:MAG: inorganic phosphate transporter [Halanaerobiales bacterium]